MMPGSSPSKSNKILESRDLSGLASYIKSDNCKKVFIMAGAGISTAAGIPDFRSPETGIAINQSNLAHLNLPTPEAVFEINFFRKNPVPFFTLAHEIAPGRFRPTMAHAFIRLLSDKGLLHTHFTQNIDTLERRVGVPDDKIVEAHGSFATSRCIDCDLPFPQDKMNANIARKSIPHCASCGGLAKPEIVFFGEGLPPMFFKKLHSLQEADLLFIMGTSLTVYPFASLCNLVPKECPRVLVNFDEVGDIGERHNDILLLGDCDEMLTKLCKALDWDADLKIVWETAKDSVDHAVDAEERGTPISTPRKVGTPPTKEDTIKDLAEQVELALKLTDEVDATHEPDEVPPAEKSPKLNKDGDGDNGKDDM